MPEAACAQELRHAVVIEDDDGVRRSLQLLLHGWGFHVRAFSGAQPALSGEAFGNADVLIADYRLPDGNGLDVMRKLRDRGWAGRAVLITAFPSEPLRAVAISCGFSSVLEKPVRRQTLSAAIAASTSV